jgi:hypothetical protein
MQPPIIPSWVVRTETLDFQFGPFKLGNIPFRALSLISNPFVVDPKLEVPLERAVALGCGAVVKYGLPVGRRFAAIRVERAALRYTTRYGLRYVIDFKASFAEYLNKFSRKSRGNLQRTVKKFAAGKTGIPDLREYRSPPEIIAFRDIAVAISHASYKSELGWGFQEGENFALQLEQDAAAGLVRGYVLMSDNQPAAYVFCRIEHDVIVYKHIGYDEKFAHKSPGTALLYLILQRLFDEGEFRLLDFDGTEYYAYKEFFATRAIRCARVVWFRPTIRNIAAVGCHWAVAATWRGASALRGSARRSGGGWQSVRRLPRMWARALTRLPENSRTDIAGP